MSIDRAMFILECLNDGIIPPVKTDIISSTPTTYLEELSPEEARKAKRRFRKLHRKIKRKKRRELTSMNSKKGWSTHTTWRTSGTQRRDWVRAQIERLDAELGQPGEKPDRHQMRKRRSEVMGEVWKRIPRT